MPRDIKHQEKYSVNKNQKTKCSAKESNTQLRKHLTAYPYHPSQKPFNWVYNHLLLKDTLRECIDGSPNRETTKRPNSFRQSGRSGELSETDVRTIRSLREG